MENLSPPWGETGRCNKELRKGFSPDRWRVKVEGSSCSQGGSEGGREIATRTWRTEKLMDLKVLHRGTEILNITRREQSSVGKVQSGQGKGYSSKKNSTPANKTWKKQKTEIGFSKTV